MSIKPTLKAFFGQNKETRVTTPEEQFYSYFELKLKVLILITRISLNLFCFCNYTLYCFALLTFV